MMSLLTQKKHKAKGNQFFSRLKSIPRVANLLESKETQLIAFFCFLFFIIILRLFQLQILEYEEYNTLLSKLHYRESLLTPERGNIYALDKGWHPVKLTENITLYDLAIDPRELDGIISGSNIPMKNRFIEIVAPVLYKHLCEVNGMNPVNKTDCIKNIELFAGVNLLPKKPELFYFWSGMESPEYQSFNFEEYEKNFGKTVDQFTKEKAFELIKTKLDQKIKIWIKTQNYLWYFTEPKFLEELAQKQLPYVHIIADHYIYLEPSTMIDPSLAQATIEGLLKKWKYPIWSQFDNLFKPQEWKYIKIISGLNPALAQEIRELKIKHRWELSKIERNRNSRQENTSQSKKERLIAIPVLYGLVLEPYTTRYYPYWNFMANILGYVDRWWTAYYGIEQYFDAKLKGKKWEIKGRTSAWLGNVGANEFEIQNPTNGSDIYLTVDIWLQREVERLAKEQLENVKADAIAILVTDAENGEVRASVSAPTFDPNNYNDAYTLIPLGRENREIIDNQTYIDIPVYVYTGGEYKLANLTERKEENLKKYIAKNIYWAQVFVDKNITVPFEPGSIFKAFTVAIGIDTDEMNFDERYVDEGSVKVWIYTIKNATKTCMGNHNFLHALVYSCNVWMVKIVQRVGKYVFYNYLGKLGFWELTGIELAEEKPWFIDKVNLVSMARFLNNAFWQGLTTTQIQLAAAYVALVNWWEYIKPTIIGNIIDPSNTENSYNKYQNSNKIFKSETSEQIKKGLFNVINTNPELSSANLSGQKLWAKSGTAQISFRGRYQRGEGWTNGTFAGVISTEDPRYVVNIWIRRPRKSQWWGSTAGPIFRQIAQYLLTYDL